MAVSGTGDWPLRSPRANLRPLHRKQLLFGLEGSRSTLLVDLFFGTAAGGSVYNEPIGETITLSEALANAGIFSGEVSEAVSLSESVGTTAVMTSSLSETMSLAEAIVSAMLYTTNPSETLTLSELLTEVLTAATAERPQNTYMLPRKAPPTGRWKGRK